MIVLKFHFEYEMEQLLVCESFFYVLTTIKLKKYRSR